MVTPPHPRATQALPELDFATEHVYNAADPVPRLPDQARAARERAPGKPVVLAEYGASGAADDPRYDPEGIHLHNGLWAGVFAGYAGPGMYWWWDEYVDPLNLWGQYRGVSAYLVGERPDLLTPGRPRASGEAVALSLTGAGRALVWVRAAAYSQDEAKRAYEDAVSESMRKNRPLRYSYSPPTVRAATITLTGLVRGAGYSATWVSTSDGSALQRGGVVVPDSGTVTLTVPDFTRDVALRLVKVPGA